MRVPEWSCMRFPFRISWIFFESFPATPFPASSLEFFTIPFVAFLVSFLAAFLVKTSFSYNVQCSWEYQWLRRFPCGCIWKTLFSDPTTSSIPMADCSFIWDEKSGILFDEQSQGHGKIVHVDNDIPSISNVNPDWVDMCVVCWSFQSFWFLLEWVISHLNLYRRQGKQDITDNVIEFLKRDHNESTPPVTSGTRFETLS